MSPLRVALYARVSGEQQVQAATIASQLAALQERIAADGCSLDPGACYVDEGVSGSSLQRPALDRLRDAVACGLVDRLYLLDPDRLARRFLDQLLLVEEFETTGVELVFVTRPLTASPEDRLLLQLQGSVAEFERAKILERCRRGRRHAAQTGQVRALSAAPYGYRYIPKAEGGGAARYEILLPEAQVVRQIFAWVALERCSTVEVCRRLAAAGIPTRSGKPRWQRPTVHDLVTNPAYQGQAAFGRTRVVTEGSQLGRSRRRRVPVPPSEWLTIPVPALVSPEVFAAAGEQLAQERQRVQPTDRVRAYLLTGLLRCARCGTAWVGHRSWKGAAGGRRTVYRYYRCQGTDRARTGGERLCASQPIRMETVDTAVWTEVCRLLADPPRVLAEYQRRLSGAEATMQHQELTAIDTQVRRAEAARDRLIESYTEGWISPVDFTSRIGRFDQRLATLEQQRVQLAALVDQEAEVRLVIGRLETFAAAVARGSEQADPALQRHLLSTLVKRVELDTDSIRIVFRVEPGPAPPSLHFCTDRATSPTTTK